MVCVNCTANQHNKNCWNNARGRLDVQSRESPQLKVTVSPIKMPTAPWESGICRTYVRKMERITA